MCGRNLPVIITSALVVRAKSGWMKKTEKMDHTLFTHNRYGVQLGTKVPLWGGMTGDGTFSLRLWTPRPKMKREDWIQYIPQLKRAAAVSATSEPLIV